TFIFPAMVAWRQRKVDRRVRKSRGDLSSELSEFLYGFRDLKVYQKLEDKEKALQEAADAYLDEQEHESVHNLSTEATNTFLSLFVSFAVLGVGAYYVSIGELDGIFLAMLLMVSITAFENTASMSVFPSHLQDSRQAAERLHHVVQTDAEQEELREGQESLLMENAPPIKVD